MGRHDPNSVFIKCILDVGTKGGEGWNALLGFS